MNPSVTVRAGGARELADVDAELLVVPVFEDDDHAQLSFLFALTNGEVQRAEARGEFPPKVHQVLVTPIPAGWGSATHLALAGAGVRRSLAMDHARRWSLSICLDASQRGFSRLAIMAPRCAGGNAVPPTLREWLQATAEGAVLASFQSDTYKTGGGRRCSLRRVVLLTGSPDSGGVDYDDVVRRGVCFAECGNLARALTNEPANRLPPATLAERAEDIGNVPGLRVRSLDEDDLEALGMRLVLGVAAGSPQPARLIVLEYAPPDVPRDRVLGLVGKGVTFDAGGLSSKGSDMENMKEDMAGGAAVICAMRAIAQQHAPVHAIGVVPAAENMPGPAGLKPGDVLRAASGTTVEILNTDAEGRLLLADGLWYARSRGATHLVDVATLTNACVHALGEFTTGLFATPASWLETVYRCARSAGDRCWPLPLFDEYQQQLRSDIADLTNSGGPAAGAVTAALFLRSFTGGLPWAHLDIAGTAWSYEARPGQPKGPTGVGVRTLATLALSSEAWPNTCCAQSISSEAFPMSAVMADLGQ
jgi:leucyl aminopeptidase